MLVIESVGPIIEAKHGKVVGMCPYRDRVLVITEYGDLFEIVDDGHEYSAVQRLVNRINELEQGNSSIAR